ncbi:SDR family NAD(P)-dependent oxidoreductase [Antarctobacter jejuensis]|uniref:SDR family NAD(P)-dependent oxidoreductase n=1 Tax=Antarctobacter jejuensis TaxID=1439938 RepID=UPI003FCFFF0B
MFAGKRVLLTGAAQGIGRALANALHQEGARLAVSDMDADLLSDVDAEVHVTADLRDPEQVQKFVADARQALGGVDILISNAGFTRGAVDGPCSVSDEQWQDSWDVHVMAHLRAARLVLPEMLNRGEGRLVNIASAAGLLSQIGDAPYSASKHAAVSLAQSLAIEHGDQGIRVSVVCPLYVATPLLGYAEGAPQDRPHDRVLTADEVAATIIEGLRRDRFLILPHPEAEVHFQRRAADMDRWIEGMQRLRRKAFEDGPPQTLADLHRRI